MSNPSCAGPRGEWGSRLGFILAAAGSAVGLGNIWRFPYMTGQNGGAAFVFIYFLCAVIIGLPVMYCELAIGRRTQRNPVGAFKLLAPGSSWRWLGFLGIATGVAILSYYSVVAGWTVGYIVLTLKGDLLGSGLPPAKIFSDFVSHGPSQILYLLVFMLLTMFVVLGGVKDGIERMSKYLMPVLLLLILVIIVRSVTLPNAKEGLRFYLVPRFDEVTAKTFIFAMGQSFFSLSLGMGAMLTYGSYLSKRENIPYCGTSVVIFDTMIAFFAGLMIFPALGGAPDKGGPGLVFIALVDIFRTMPLGTLISLIFFTLLAIAALTSTVSLLEVAAAYLIDERGWSRRRAVLTTGAVCAAIGVPCALSLGAVPGLASIVAGMGFLDLMDFLFGNISLTFGGLLICLFVTYRWRLKAASEEISLNATLFPRIAGLWAFGVRVLSPIAITALLVYIFVTGKAF